MAVIGIDVGGQSIRAGIVTNKGNVLHKIVVMTEADKGRVAVVENILKVAEVLLDIDKKIKSIGIGIPGIVDKDGFVHFTPNIPLSNYDLGKELKKRLKRRLVFGNDADNFALAKHVFGTGKGKANIVCLTLGTGVGSGIIINGQLFANKGAPELGHTTIKFDGKKAKCCKNDGCIESYIGRKSFDGSPLDVYKKAVAGDKAALKKFEQYGTYLGIAISNFVNIFNPDLVILGGQLSNAFDFFKKTMEEQIHKRALFKARVIKSKMREAGMIGAAALAF